MGGLDQLINGECHGAVCAGDIMAPMWSRPLQIKEKVIDLALGRRPHHFYVATAALAHPGKFLHALKRGLGMVSPVGLIPRQLFPELSISPETPRQREKASASRRCSWQGGRRAGWGFTSPSPHPSITCVTRYEACPPSF